MFRHEALLYRGSRGFLAGSLPYIRAGIASDEAILVAVDAAKIRSVRGALAADADRVQFADMAVLGLNPARIIPAWREFADGHPGPIRGIGEPIWPGRGGDELVECQLHEALLNVAFADRPDFQLLCPYDTDALNGSVIHEACSSHPHVDGAPSRAYRDDLLAPFDAPLPPPPATARILGFELDTTGEVRRLVEQCARRAGLAPEREHDLVLAVSELAGNSIRHGGGRGILRIWKTEEALVCEIRDRGRIVDPLAGRVRPGLGQLDGRGLWIANSVCDLVQVRAGAVRAYMRF